MSIQVFAPFFQKHILREFQEAGLQELLNLGGLLKFALYHFVVYGVKEKGPAT